MDNFLFPLIKIRLILIIPKKFKFHIWIAKGQEKYKHDEIKNEDIAIMLDKKPNKLEVLSAS